MKYGKILYGFFCANLDECSNLTKMIMMIIFRLRRSLKIIINLLISMQNTHLKNWYFLWNKMEKYANSFEVIQHNGKISKLN